MKTERYADFSKFINDIEKHNVKIDYSKLESFNPFDDTLQKMITAKKIIYAFEDYVINYCVDTYPQDLIDKLIDSIEFIETHIETIQLTSKQYQIYLMAVEDGYEVLKQIHSFEPLKIAL